MDPHHIDNHGRYRRFILRLMILRAGRLAGIAE